MGFSGQQLLWNYYGWSAACAQRLNFLSAARTGGFCRCPHLQPLDDNQKTRQVGFGGLGFRISGITNTCQAHASIFLTTRSGDLAGGDEAFA